jgi:hypothetical protein
MENNASYTEPLLEDIYIYKLSFLHGGFSIIWNWAGAVMQI